MGKEGRKFDTKIQYLKYKVLREVARIAYNSDSGFELANSFNDIAKVIVPGPKATMRCCIYKERAIIAERIKMACGGNKNNPNVIEVIDIACDECPASGYQVSHDCRGCIAHRCQNAPARTTIFSMASASETFVAPSRNTTAKSASAQQTDFSACASSSRCSERCI